MGTRAAGRPRLLPPPHGGPVQGPPPAQLDRWLNAAALARLPSHSPDGSLSSTVRSVTDLWRYELDTSRRGLLAALPFVPTAFGEWLVSYSFDLAHHGQAQQYFKQALHLAKEADDDLTGIWVLAAMIRQAFHLEEPRWAYRLTHASLDQARRAQAPPRVMANLLVRHAWASASLSEGASGRAEAERLLVEAERQFALGPTDRDPFWVAHINAPELTAEIGMCWQALGDHKRAAECAEAACNGFDRRFARSAHFNRVHAADAYLSMGELEQALSSAHAALPTAKSLSSARASEFLQRFDRKLDDYGATPQVRDFRTLRAHGSFT